MARYTVEFRRSAEKDLRRLEPAVQRRVLRAADALADNPRPNGCRKLQGSENAFRIRVGDYRVIYTVDDAVLIVAIERVRHRREVYR
ncbi:MAG: type II toxin-antitoxin system RelE/ParE family toxin [Verrucomicrobiaceae bacterium]|nr:type II toxin-antitoxin system RelE/ParE family toxin [Verrucomicrobiaceae bacterium]